MDANLIKNNDLHGMAHRFLTFSSFFYDKWLTNVAIVCTQQLRNRNQACIVVIYSASTCSAARVSILCDLSISSFGSAGLTGAAFCLGLL
jgi:hypothetical protein